MNKKTIVGLIFGAIATGIGMAVGATMDKKNVERLDDEELEKVDVEVVIPEENVEVIEEVTEG